MSLYTSFLSTPALSDTSKEVMLARINKLEQAIRSGNTQVNTNLEEVKSQVSNETSNNKTLNNKQTSN